MRIAVSGLGIISAMGTGVNETLAALRSSRSGVGEVSLFETVHRVPVCEVKRDNRALKAMLAIPVDAAISRTALLGMVAASQALADAGTGASLRTGLVSATSTGGMDLTENFFREFAVDDSKGRLRDVVGHECADSTARIARYCDITGFSTTISTACSSAANAIMFGAQLIKRGIVDRVVAGGTDALCRFTLNGFRSLAILSGEPCRPFDANRAGLNLGEGAGYVVLQRDDTLDKTPYGYLTGYANANDAFHQTASSAEGEGAYLAMSKALTMSGLSPADIDYINAHGTGTPNNDASEAVAFVRLFGGNLPPFSSTKPFTGHTLAAAGGIEAVISLLALKNGILVPNLNFATPMEEPKLRPQRALVEGVEIKHVLSNSFGFGGNNSTLIFSAL
jgi:3-oxoacyl-[acyl-carrier-protein] synthase-1